MKRIYSILVLILLAAGSALAQNPYAGEVRVDFDQMVLTGQQVTLRATVDLSRLELDRNNMITLTPVLRSQDGSRELALDKVIVSGFQRAKVIQRNRYFGGGHPEVNSRNFHVRTPGHSRNTITLEYTVPFERWMRHSQMVVAERASGCGNSPLIYGDGRSNKMYVGAPHSLYSPYQPAFTVSYLVPRAEAVKVISETYAAALNFVVNRTELLRDFRDNGRILGESDEIIEKIKTDSLLSISRIVVRGYASPEGNEAANLRLSQGRAQAFVDYLHDRHGFYQADDMLTAEGLGEDWTGLRHAVEATSMADRDRVLAAIDNIPEIDRRKTAIRNLSGGTTYRMLLNDYYPLLRRNEYTISYEVRGFNVQEATALIHSRPHLLSLNEMFMVSEQYRHDSPEFKNVFDIAVRQYPDSEIAQFNAAAMEIENGAYDTAIRRLENIHTPEAWNNLGVAYWQRGEYEKAREYLRRAVDTGSSEARGNLAEFNAWEADR